MRVKFYTPVKRGEDCFKFNIFNLKKGIIDDPLYMTFNKLEKKILFLEYFYENAMYE